MWEWFTATETWTWFTEPFKGQNWWQILNAGFVGTIVSSIVGIFLAKRVGDVAHESKVETQAKQAAEREQSRLEDSLGAEAEAEEGKTSGTSDAPTRAPLDPAARQTFHRASTAIRRLKDYVDALADRVRDGRTKRKYNNITRRDYRVITTAIAHDGGLKDADAEKISSAFEKWRTYRNGRTLVPDDIATELEKLAERYRVTTATPAKWNPNRPPLIQF